MLYPLYDSSDKVFGKMACQIWEEMQESCGGEMDSGSIAYVELIVNHQYQGIYGLQEGGEKMEETPEENAGASKAMEKNIDSVIDYELYWQFFKLPEDSQGETEAYRRLVSSDGSAIQKRAGERWNQYRNTIYSEEHLKALAQGCMDELTFSGALTRDAFRWPEAENSSDLTELYRVIEERLAFLDEYFGES